MNQVAKVPASDEAWDAGALGREKKHAKKVRVDDAVRAKQDEGLDLQLISIRMPRALIDDLKQIARLNNMGYQPLARQALTRFVTSELKRIARDRMAELQLAGTNGPPTTPVAARAKKAA